MKINFKNYQTEYLKFLNKIKNNLIYCGFDEEKASSVAKSFSGLFTPNGPSKTADECTREYLQKCSNDNGNGYSAYMFPKSYLLRWKEFGVKVCLNKALYDDVKKEKTS